MIEFFFIARFSVFVLVRHFCQLILLPPCHASRKLTAVDDDATVAAKRNRGIVLDFADDVDFGRLAAFRQGDAGL